MDDVFGGYEGPLGVAIERGSSGGFAGFGGVDRDAASVTVRVWAPTARRVRFRLFDRASGNDPSFDTEMTETEQKLAQEEYEEQLLPSPSTAKAGEK